MNKKINKIKIFSLIVLASLFFSGCSSSELTQPQYKLTLEIWGFDDGDAFSEAFNNYRKLNPSIKEVIYKKQMLNLANYKDDLVEAIAAGNGPDIFLIHNAWLPIFKNKIVEAPADVMSEQKVKNNFVDVVSSDFVEGGKIFALPMSVDSLALYYNKDLFNEAGITQPPGDWNAFVEDSRKMTKIDSAGQIIRSGAALGTAYNINRATDILSVMMMQNGTEMTDAKKSRAIFDTAITTTEGGGGSKTSFTGQNALEFYASFAKTNSAAYSWNSNMHYSLDAFSEGKLGMMLNYSWQRDAIANKSPKLNFEIAPLPQLPGRLPISYANYWGFAVAKNKSVSSDPQNTSQTKTAPAGNDIRTKEAWKLISYLTTKPEINASVPAASGSSEGDLSYDAAKKYMEKTAKPAARRDLIEIQKSDAKLGVFARQNLIAKSWYQADPQAIEGIMAEIIDQINRGQVSVKEALTSAAARVSVIMQNR